MQDRMLVRRVAPSTEGSGKRPRRPIGSVGTSNSPSTTPIISQTSSTTQFLPYKLLSISSMNGKENGRTFTIRDKTGRSYLADTGADISVFPASQEDQRRPAQTPLAAANRTGSKRMEIEMCTYNSGRGSFGKISLSLTSHALYWALIFSRRTISYPTWHERDS